MSASRTRTASFGIALNLLLQLSQQLQFRSQTSERQSEQGLSLIECLVAIIIVSLTVLAITPPILLATGTRVQSRRAEQANHIAQSEMDRVRLLVERGSYTTTDLPAVSTTSGVDTNIGAAGPATSIAANLLLSPSSCNTYPGSSAVAWNSVVLVDVDGDCTADFAMQVYRNTGQIPVGDPSTNPPYVFDVGVRVYTYIPGQSLPTLQTQRASLVSATNARDTKSGNTRLPLAVLYSKLSRNDQSKSLGAICQQQGGGSTCPP